MGIYLNPGNSGFKRILGSEYIDKTGIIAKINDTIDTPKNLISISRARRFGKSYTAQMLCAYYDITCDSKELFDGLDISGYGSYGDYLNKYDVIYLDMTGIIGETDFNDIVPYIKRNITSEIIEKYPDVKAEEGFVGTLVNMVTENNRKLIMIIDEWDAPIREAKDDEKVQKEYLDFLRSLFKNSGTTSRIFAAAYMTGILPIKKDGSESALSDFNEYTMIKPRQFGEYVGFTEAEVRHLCDKHNVDVEKMKKWYDGYSFANVGSVYNPNSVMQAIDNEDFDSYWTETSAAENLMDYITKDFSGLSKTIAELIAGIDVPVDTNGFANDLTTFRNSDDVLTLMIHLGYVAYDSEKKTVHIPNEEIRREFSKTVKVASHNETIRRLKESEQLIADTIHMNEEAVAAHIEKIHSEETAPIHYNSENSLRSVIKLAYYTYRDYYVQWEELPAGVGYADVVYLPKKDSMFPALVIELKWNKDADTAIKQIHDRKYPEALKGFCGEVILVGVNYDKDAEPGKRKHSCKIEKITL